MRMMNRMKRKVALVVACIMCSLTASAAANSVSYVDYTWNEESKTLSSETKSVDTYTEITSTTTEMTSGWYVVNGEVTVAERMTATGEVHLILADGAHLTASLGITVNEGNSLYIYGQSSDESTMGKLTATTTTTDYDAAIGGLMSNHAGTIVINGGNINASTSGDGAGIGSGGYRGGYQITINAGVVTATSSNYGAAIGSGNYPGLGVRGTVHSICINGGVVNATVTANSGAAIGGGNAFDGGDITITGGTVTATQNGKGAAIGGGSHGSGGNITITGGNVTATYTHSVYYGVAIGAGYYGESAGNILITGGTVTATSTRGCGIGVYNGDNGRIVILGGTVNASGSGNVHINAGASGSMMLVDGTTVTISGDFTLQTDFLLPEGYTLEISEGATLTIPEGVTLTLPEEYTLISNGTVNAVGTVNCISHKYVEGVCICGLECNHVGGTPTCTAPAVCTTCGTGYGEVDPTNHNWENGVCTYGCNTIHEPHDWSGKDGICTVCGVSCDHKDSTHTTANNNGNVITESCSKCKVSLATATLTATSATYDGTEKEGAMVEYSTGWTGESNLTVTYADNVNAGTATASITFGGVTARATFTILPKDITGATVATQGSSFVYSGEPLTPEVSVTLDGKHLAVSDYQVSYGDNVNAGQATVTVTGKGNYSGSATTTFTIDKAPAPTLPAIKVSRNYAATKVSVPTGIVAGEGSAVSVGTASGSGAGKVSNPDLDDKGNLTFTLSGGAKDDEIVLPVSIQSPNYEGTITATVAVTLTDKLDQRPLTVKATGTTVAAGGTLELSASGGSGKGAVTYEVIKGTGSASVSGSTLTGEASGTVTVIATKVGTSQYNPARSQPLVITIE